MNHPNSTSETRLLRKTYQTTISLPTYENVMAEEGSKKLETPPPVYNELTFPSWLDMKISGNGRVYGC